MWERERRSHNKAIAPDHAHLTLSRELRVAGRRIVELAQGGLLARRQQALNQLEDHEDAHVARALARVLQPPPAARGRACRAELQRRRGCMPTGSSGAGVGAPWRHASGTCPRAMQRVSSNARASPTRGEGLRPRACAPLGEGRTPRTSRHVILTPPRADAARARVRRQRGAPKRFSTRRPFLLHPRARAYLLLPRRPPRRRASRAATRRRALAPPPPWATLLGLQRPSRADGSGSGQDADEAPTSKRECLRARRGPRAPRARTASLRRVCCAFPALGCNHASNAALGAPLRRGAAPALWRRRFICRFEALLSCWTVAQFAGDW